MVRNPAQATDVGAVEPFVISRTFDVSRDKLWKAFTDPAEMKKWWGPKGFTVVVSNMDFRVGGSYHYGLQASGQTIWGKFLYQDINPPEYIILNGFFSDEEGNVTRHPLSPTWPAEMLSTYRFTEKEGKATLTIEWQPLNGTAEEIKTFNESHASMQQGWTGTLDQLQAYFKNA